jgi:poly(beta-D-mannuronate) lyase
MIKIYALCLFRRKIQLKVRMIFLLMILFLSAGTMQVTAKITSVTDVQQLSTAIQNLQAGDTINVADGMYDLGGSVIISTTGTETQPILIRAANRNKVTFVNNSFFNLKHVSYVTIEGFVFNSTDGTAITLESSRHCRITRNVFSLIETKGSKWILIRDSRKASAPISSYNRIDHNLFENKSHIGNMITTDGFRNDTLAQVSQHDVIDHNYFKNVGPRIGNGMETIRLGVGELAGTSGFTVIEYNLFEECSGDAEIISVKCDDNIIRSNTFIRCQGSVCLRQSSRSLIDGNFFFGEGKEGTGGVRVFRDNNIVINNYFTGLTGKGYAGTLAIPNGDKETFAPHEAGHLPPVHNIIAFNTLVGNVHNIEIGFAHGGKDEFPPRDNVIANNLIVTNNKDAFEVYTSPVNQTYEGNICFPSQKAKVGIDVTAAQVRVIDPKLELKDGLYKLSADSPARHTATGNYEFVTTDMDGQPRGAIKDASADEFSSRNIISRPLHTQDVGPDAISD